MAIVKESSKEIIILNPVAILTFRGDFSLPMASVKFTQYAFYNKAEQRTWLIVEVDPANFQTELSMKTQFNLIEAAYRSHLKKLPLRVAAWYKEKNFTIKK